jgi:hypothetical protein
VVAVSSPFPFVQFLHRAFHAGLSSRTPVWFVIAGSTSPRCRNNVCSLLYHFCSLTYAHNIFIYFQTCAVCAVSNTPYRSEK